MKTHEVQSRMVTAVGYDRATRQLFVQFRSGNCYQYGVHPRIFTALRKAPSAGKFLGETVIGKYEAKRVA